MQEGKEATRQEGKAESSKQKVENRRRVPGGGTKEQEEVDEGVWKGAKPRL